MQVGDQMLHRFGNARTIAQRDFAAKWRQSAKFIKGLQHSYYSYFRERSAASSAFGDLGDRISRHAVKGTATRTGAANLMLAQHDTLPQARLGYFPAQN
jgi:hypothetical protein